MKTCPICKEARYVVRDHKFYQYRCLACVKTFQTSRRPKINEECIGYYVREGEPVHTTYIFRVGSDINKVFFISCEAVGCGNIAAIVIGERRCTDACSKKTPFGIVWSEVCPEFPRVRQRRGQDFVFDWGIEI
jgi:hypothetical protein